MNRNHLIIAFSVLLLAAVAMVLLEPLGGFNGDPDEHENATNIGQAAAVGADDDLASGSSGQRIAEREPDSATQLQADFQKKERDPGIPSFLGRVVNDQQLPVAGATVTAYGMPGRARGYDPDQPAMRPFAELTATTDKKGQFKLGESPHEGLRWLVRVEHEKHPLLELTDLSSIPGRCRDLGLLQLASGSTVQGQVTDPDGYPLLNAQVIALRGAAGMRLSKWLEADSFPLPGAEDVTARDGGFQITNLPPGPIRLQAAAPGFVTSISAEANLKSGQFLKDLHLVLPRSVPINGQVISTDGEPIEGATIRSVYEPQGSTEAISNSSGHFALELPAGASRVRIAATAPGFGQYQQSLKSSQQQQLQQNQQPLEIRLAEIQPLHGVVLDFNSNPIAGASVALFEQSRMRLARFAPELSSALNQTTSGTDGRFELAVDATQTADRRLRVVAWADGHFADSSGTLRFEQRGGKVPDGLSKDIILRLQPGSVISGSVRDESGSVVANARVHLRRHGGVGKSAGLAASLSTRDGEIVAVASANAVGGFAFPDLAPGEYHLEAMRSGYSPGQTEPFVLDKDQTLNVDVQLCTAANIRGKIYGNAEHMGRLRLLAISEMGRVYTATIAANHVGSSAAERSYALEEMPPGQYRLELYASNATPQGGWGRPQGPLLCDPEIVTLMAGQNEVKDLYLDFEQLAAIDGTVLVNGHAAADYRVFLVPAGLEGSESKEQRQQTMDRVRSTSSNFDGRFTFEGLAADEFWLVLAPPLQSSNGNVGVTGLIGNVGGFAKDDGPQGLARAHVELEEGERTQHHFHLQTSALAGVAMRPTADGAVPLRGGIGYLFPGQEHQGVRRFAFAIRADGSFHVPAIPAGNWIVDLRSGRYRLKKESVLLTPGGVLQREFLLKPSKDKNKSGDKGSKKQ